jgi:hypothetical protein
LAIEIDSQESALAVKCDVYPFTYVRRLKEAFGAFNRVMDAEIVALKDENRRNRLSCTHAQLP